MHRSAVGRRKLTVCVKGHSRKIDSDTCVFGWVGGGGGGGLQACPRRNRLTLSTLLILSSFAFYFERHIFSSYHLHFTYPSYLAGYHFRAPDTYLEERGK